MMRKAVRMCKKIVKARCNRIKANGKTKYFCIGRNKTGTTSLRKAFEDLGYLVGDQLVAEKLADDNYFEGDFYPIIKYCRSAQVFQDVPFSWPETYKHIDEAYPNSKFILTVRNDDKQWYESLVKFHAKEFGQGSTPTVDDLRNASYVSKGWMYNTVRIHGTSDDDPYSEEVMLAHYNAYNQGVLKYFQNRPDDLLVINLADEGSYQHFADFLQITSPYNSFPWENRT